jgi:hypothetical protein
MHFAILILAVCMLAVSPLTLNAQTTCHATAVVEFKPGPDGVQGTADDIPEKIADCQGACDGTSVCEHDSRNNHHGGRRTWCDCDADGVEPEQACRVVLIKLGKGEGGPGKRLVCAGFLCPGLNDHCKTGQPPDNLGVVRNFKNGNQTRMVSCCQTNTPASGEFAAILLRSISPLPGIEDFERGGFSLPQELMSRTCAPREELPAVFGSR